MEFSSSLLNSLKQIGNEDFLSDSSFQELIKFVFDSFIIKNKLGDFSQNLDIQKLEKIGKTPGEFKEITGSLYTLITELARHDVDINTASTFLEDNGFTAEKIKSFIENYQDKLSIIRLILLSSSTSFPHIVDVNWRLDYCIKENNLERINEPVYLIELKLEKPEQQSFSKIQFSCTVEQLQDLVYKLKEATKSVEKIAQV